MDFSIELAKSFLDSDEQFPVEFDNAWQWLGYTRKDSALDTLKSYFEEGLDFSGCNRKSSQGGRPSHSYCLTVDCFKQLGMLARTNQGKLVRQYFLECERVAKQAIVPTPQPEAPKLGSSVAETTAMLSPLKQLLSSVPESLVDGFLLNQLQLHHPELKDTINAAHSLLAAINPIPEVLLTPTAIGERLGVSARVVNALLTENGYQVKNIGKSKTEPAYLPTELGERYSSNTLATGKGRDNTSYQHTKWQESIVEVLRGLM